MATNSRMLDTIESAHTRFIDGVSMAEWLGSNKAPLLSIYISWRLLRLFAWVLSSERRGLAAPLSSPKASGWGRLLLFLLLLLRTTEAWWRSSHTSDTGLSPRIINMTKRCNGMARRWCGRHLYCIHPDLAVYIRQRQTADRLTQTLPLALTSTRTQHRHAPVSS